MCESQAVVSSSICDETLGRLALALDDPTTALSHSTDALAAYERTGMRGYAARTRFDLARIRHALDEDWRTDLDAASDTASSLGFRQLASEIEAWEPA